MMELARVSPVGLLKREPGQLTNPAPSFLLQASASVNASLPLTWVNPPSQANPPRYPGHQMVGNLQLIHVHGGWVVNAGWDFNANYVVWSHSSLF